MPQSSLAITDSLEVIWAYCQYLQFDNFIFPDNIESNVLFLENENPRHILAEWTLEKLAGEIIQHARVLPRFGRSLREWNSFAFIVNELRALEDEIDKQIRPDDQILFEIMRIAHRQFVWQQNRFNSSIFIRYYKIFGTPEINTISKQNTGLSIKEIYAIGMCFLSHFIKNPRFIINSGISISGLTQQHLRCFLKFTSIGRNELVSRLKAGHALDERFSYRFSPLREYPLVQISQNGSDEVICPLPTLLLWRFTMGLYYTLNSSPEFSNEIGKSFESYIGDVLSKVITDPARSVLCQQTYHVKKDEKQTVDWILQ